MFRFGTSRTNRSVESLGKTGKWWKRGTHSPHLWVTDFERNRDRANGKTMRNRIRCRSASSRARISAPQAAEHTNAPAASRLNKSASRPVTKSELSGGNRDGLAFA